MDKRDKGKIIGIVIVICVVAIYLIYTCSQTIEQRYPSLNILDCTEIKVYYSEGSDMEDAEYIIDADDSRFLKLLQLIQSAETRKKLSNIFPQGTRTHILASDDFNMSFVYVVIQSCH